MKDLVHLMNTLPCFSTVYFNEEIEGDDRLNNLSSIQEMSADDIHELAEYFNVPANEVTRLIR